MGFFFLMGFNNLFMYFFLIWISNMGNLEVQMCVLDGNFEM